jgi:hypothetical protein
MDRTPPRKRRLKDALIYLVGLKSFGRSLLLRSVGEGEGLGLAMLADLLEKNERLRLLRELQRDLLAWHRYFSQPLFCLEERKEPKLKRKLVDRLRASLQDSVGWSILVDLDRLACPGLIQLASRYPALVELINKGAAWPGPGVLVLLVQENTRLLGENKAGRLQLENARQGI